MSMESNFNYKKIPLWNFLSMSANTKMLVTLQVSTFICGKHVETEIGRYVFKKSDGYFLTPDPQSGKSIMNGFEDKIDSRNLIVESYRVNGTVGSTDTCALSINVKDNPETVQRDVSSGMKEIGDGIKTVTKRGVEVLKSAVSPDNN